MRRIRGRPPGRCRPRGSGTRRSGDELLAQASVAGRGSARSRACAPRGGPAPVVGAVGGEGADAAGPGGPRDAVGVDDQGGVGDREGEQAAELGGHGVRGVGGLFLLGARAAGRARTARPRRCDSRTRGRRSGPSRSARTWSAAESQLACDLALSRRQRGLDRCTGTPVSASPVMARSVMPNTSATDVRSSSRRRTERTAATAASASSRSAGRGEHLGAERVPALGASSASSPNMATASGARSSRPAA